MNKLVPLTIHVKEEHIGLFYELLGYYHRDTNVASKRIETLARGNDELAEAPSKASVEVPKGSSTTGYKGDLKTGKTFHEYVVTECTCGSCMKRFARTQRTPWRGDGLGRFVNSEYGIIELKGCNVTKFNGSGSIHRSIRSQVEIATLQETENKIELGSLKKQAEIIAIRTNATIIDAKASKAKEDAALARGKAASELKRLKQKDEAPLQAALKALEAVEEQHSDAYDKEFAKILKVEMCNLDHIYNYDTRSQAANRNAHECMKKFVNPYLRARTKAQNEVADKRRASWQTTGTRPKPKQRNIASITGKF